MLTLRAASFAEADALTELCLRSKAVWGYDEEFLRACRSELTITPWKMRESFFQVAIAEGELAGVAQLSLKESSAAELEALFVEPRLQGLGTGRALFQWAISICRDHGRRTLLIESDPGAASFYKRMGAKETGVVPSGSIPGRMIPRFEFDVPDVSEHAIPSR